MRHSREVSCRNTSKERAAMMLRAVVAPRPPILRMARCLCILFLAGLLFLSGVAGGVLLVGYQARVAVEQMRAWGARLILLEAQYARDHQGALRTTKAQAQVIAQRADERPAQVI